MRTDLFDYSLPPELIAQTPRPRGDSRLLVLHRQNGTIEHRQFSDLIEYLRPGDRLVLNDTRVTARRLRARREQGEPAEVFLLRPANQTQWEALVRPGKSLRPGKTLWLAHPYNGASEMVCQVVGETPEGGRLLQFENTSARDSLASAGETPLPPYISTPLPSENEERYQTIYATHGGSAAAPTAGLHFTADLLKSIEQIGCALTHITLHVGVGTFRPVRSEILEAHEMHSEKAFISSQAAAEINGTEGRVIAVGTTAVRTLESAASNLPSPEYEESTKVRPFDGETRLFITPGYRFQVVDALITNFHQPRSTLLMLVSALAGVELIRYAYAEAIRERYRFFSFGDAMFIV